MHEFSLMSDLLKKIESIARDCSAERVTAVTIKLGALAHITPDHFREHFETAIIGSVAEGAVLNIKQLTDDKDPNAQDILLESVDIAA